MLRMVICLLSVLGAWSCGDSPTSPGAKGRIVLEVRYDAGESAKPASTAIVDRMVATVSQNGTVLVQQDLRQAGPRWVGEIAVEAGSYEVRLEAQKGGAVKWRGNSVVEVQAGKPSRAMVQMVSVGTGSDQTTTPSALNASLPGGVVMEMVWIRPGSFTMGSPSSEPGRDGDEGPQHQVTISKGFYLGKYEITQAQWEAVMGSNPSYSRGDNRPVEQVSWEDLQGFVQKLNTAAGEVIYRLPTESEWEYACRAGTASRWSYGDDQGQLGDYAWYSGNSNGTVEVGTKQPNPWGLYDMHGNVWEWVQDWYGAYSSSRQTDPTGPSSGSYRVLRGGSFNYHARFTRSAYRVDITPVFRGYYLGARLLRTK